MQAAGMRVIPYINGQLFDTLIPRWKADDAMAATQKFLAEERMATPGHPVALTPHLEHFVRSFYYPDLHNKLLTR